MAFNIKPKKPKWADGAPAYTAEPSEGKKSVGWQSQEKPPFQWMNWLFLKIKSWLDWTEDRTEFQDSVSFHTTGGTVDWSGAVITVPVDGLYIEWRDGASIINNILPQAAYALADGEYLVFVPHNTTGHVLTAGTYATLEAGEYAIVLGADLIDKTDVPLHPELAVTEIILFRRRGAVPASAILEVPLFKTAVQSGGSLASNDLLVHHHSDADDGGQLDWDDVWADGVHSHGSNAEGGTLTWGTIFSVAGAGTHNHQSNTTGDKLDHGDALNGLGDDDHTQYSKADGTRAFTGTVGGITPTLDAHLVTKGYVDGLIPDMSHVCMDNTTETIGSAWYHEASLYIRAFLYFQDNVGSWVSGGSLSTFNNAHSWLEFRRHSVDFEVAYWDLTSYGDLPMRSDLAQSELGMEFNFLVQFQVVEDGGGTRDVVLATFDGMSDHIAHCEAMAVIYDDGYGGDNYASTTRPIISMSPSINGEFQGVVSNIAGHMETTNRIMYANTTYSQFDFIWDGDNITLRYDMFGDDRTRYGQALFRVRIGPYKT